MPTGAASSVGNWTARWNWKNDLSLAALSSRTAAAGLVHHSGPGFGNASADYTDLLKDNKIPISINCKENK
jgi:hypothetical protein